MAGNDSETAGRYAHLRKHLKKTSNSVTGKPIHTTQTHRGAAPTAISRRGARARPEGGADDAAFEELEAEVERRGMRGFPVLVEQGGTAPVAAGIGTPTPAGKPILW